MILTAKPLTDIRTHIGTLTDMRWTVKLADGKEAFVSTLQVRDTYEGFLEGTLEGMTRAVLERRAERMPLKEPDRKVGVLRRVVPGRVLSPRGYYLLEPSFMPKEEFLGAKSAGEPGGLCLKDREICADLEISTKEGQYSIRVEWFQSTKEISEIPLTEIVNETISSLSLPDIKDYCRFMKWDEF